MAWVDLQDSTDRKKARCSLWIWIVFVLLWACGVCVLIVYGVDLLTRSAEQLLNNIESQPISYFNTTKNTINALVSDSSLSLTAFDDVINEFGDQVSNVRNNYFKYFTIAKIVSICVGVVGVVVTLLIFAFAFCRCATFGFHYSGVFYLFSIIYALLAVVFTLIQYVMYSICGEVSLHAQREPGIFTWYLVPWCEKKFDFTGVKDNLATTESTTSDSACSSMEQHSIIYNGQTGGTTYFTASPLIDRGTCTSFSVVSTVISSLVLDATYTSQCSGKNPCTISTCVEYCTDSTLKTAAQNMVTAAQTASDASTALSLVKPLLDCYYVIDQIASAFETTGTQSQFQVAESNDQCTNMRTSATMVACGFFVGTLMYMMGIYVLHRGRWIWKSKPYRDLSPNDGKDSGNERRKNEEKKKKKHRKHSSPRRTSDSLEAVNN
ncbi:hypothetical protein STCU_06953 [Strigomonas culicis]|uniref:Uncharacterized protein n=1 Tax=Strigomonas culicis TaxID=28005 RepID=S9VNM4_9TRYP|nr:hypothetical protein STCU_06953 [Strigomonas culicis]|eukprot:EPY24890.1 hypothetical protein STCU_06953 [Strigomonas culicis]